MKNVILIFLLFFTSLNSILSQVEFGTIGSSWNYNYHSHNGNGGGWTKISITGDTLINNETQKILSRTTYNYTDIPFEEYQDSSFLGIMAIRNDSVFFNENLILDFNMQIDDSLEINTLAGVNIKLAIDSIITQIVDGYEYKRWFGQQICLNNNGNYPYEEFEIFENVGQVGFDYLLWNSDGCIIGGGSHSFVCYENGGFTYPIGSNCESFILVGIENELENLVEKVEIFPNPFENYLTFKNKSSIIKEIKVYDITGTLKLFKVCNSNNCNLSTSNLTKGIYISETRINNRKLMNKILKN